MRSEDGPEALAMVRSNRGTKRRENLQRSQATEMQCVSRGSSVQVLRSVCKIVPFSLAALEENGKFSARKARLLASFWGLALLVCSSQAEEKRDIPKLCRKSQGAER